MGFHSQHGRAGLVYGLCAYAIWGFLPVFFRLLDGIGAGEIVAQRILWSVVFLAALVVARGGVPAFRAALRNPRAILILSVTAALIAINWLVYVWAVLHHHVLEASLGYFLNPLLNVALGMIFLKELLNRPQMVAVGLAAAGVAVLAAGAGGGLWISLALALSFGGYGLLRKIAPVEALEGLSIETLILAPFAFGWLVWLWRGGQLGFGLETATTLLLMVSGILTAVPLLLFAAAARRMPYATLGLLQYVAPTLQFALAIAYGEHLTTAHIICFACIWIGLAIYAGSSLTGARRARSADLA